MSRKCQSQCGQMKGHFAQFPHAKGTWPAPSSARAVRRRGPGPGRHTDGAVLAVPAGATLALAVAAGSVLCAAGVAGPLVAGCPHPAILAAAGAPHADAVATTVSSTDLCGDGEGGKRARMGRIEKTKDWVSH